MMPEMPLLRSFDERTRRSVLILALVVAAVTFAVHLPSLQNQFVIWDDDLNVYQNEHIRSLDLQFLYWAFTDMASGNWQPLTWISHALDHAVWGLDPFGSHATNVLLHTINTFLVVWLVTGLLTLYPASLQYAPGSPAEQANGRTSLLIAGGIAGILFGCHPLRVEPVSWISSRTDLLCTLFYLLSLIAYAEYARTTSTRRFPDAHGSPAYRWYLSSLVLYLLAAFSKPMAVTLPAVLLLLDWHPFERISSGRAFARLTAEKLPFIMVSVLLIVLTIQAESHLGAIASFADVSLRIRLIVAIKAIGSYIVKTVWPYHLAPLYPYPNDPALFSFENVFVALAVSLGTIAGFFVARMRKVLRFGWAFFLIALLPVLGIIKARPVFMADRYAYLPSFGLSLIAGVIAVSIWSRVQRTGSRPWKIVVILLGLFVTSGLCVLTIRQNAVWKDTLSLWNHVIDREGIHSFEAYVNRGSYYGEQGDCDRAIEDFFRAIAVRPSDATGYGNLAVALECKGYFDRALEYYAAAISLNPAGHSLYYNRGILHSKMGMVAKAIADYSSALERNPDLVAAQFARANAYRDSGQRERAVRDYQAACARGSEDACRMLMLYSVR
jgi:tetratricopeptide (TPR) repeat protein